MKDYSVKIKESSREFSAKERIQIKDTTDAVKLDEATQADSVVIYPKDFAVLAIHNEKADDKDYEQYVIIDKENNKYVTGSTSFWTSFTEIADEMENEDEEWGIKVYRSPSKNYAGRDFITCSII